MYSVCPGGSDNFTVWVTGEAFSSLTTDPPIKITTLVYPLEPRDTVLLEESYLRSPLSKKTASQGLRCEAPNPCMPASCHTAAHMTSLGLSSKTKQVPRSEAGPREAWQCPPCFPDDPEPRPQHSAPHHSGSWPDAGGASNGGRGTPCVQDPQQHATEATAGARLHSVLVQGEPAHHRKMSPKESTSKHQPAGGSGEGTRAAATHAGRHPEKTAIKYHHGREGVRDQGSQLWPW